MGNGTLRILDSLAYLSSVAARASHVEMVSNFCDPSHRRWTFKATVFRSGKGESYVGYGGTLIPSNVSPLVHGAEMRIARN